MREPNVALIDSDCCPSMQSSLLNHLRILEGFKVVVVNLFAEGSQIQTYNFGREPH